MTLTDEQFQVIINARLEKLFDLYPIEDLRPTEVSEEMKEGLSKFYGTKGMRAYLENAIKISIQKLAIGSSNVENAYYKGRVDTLQQLLANGKQMFTTTEVVKQMRQVKGVKQNAA